MVAMNSKDCFIRIDFCRRSPFARRASISPRRGRSPPRRRSRTPIRHRSRTPRRTSRSPRRRSRSPRRGSPSPRRRSRSPRRSPRRGRRYSPSPRRRSRSPRRPVRSPRRVPRRSRCVENKPLVHLSIMSNSPSILILLSWTNVMEIWMNLVLPNHLSSIPTLPAFRRALKHHLFPLAYPDGSAKSDQKDQTSSMYHTSWYSTNYCHCTARKHHAAHLKAFHLSAYD